MSDETTRLDEMDEVNPEEPAGSEAQAPDRDVEAASEETASEPGPDERIAELEAETSDLKDKLLRSLAEVDNVRKRAAREVVDARAYAIEKFAGDLLSVSDNLARALQALPEPDRHDLSEAGKGLLGGIEMTEKELHAVMARHGMTVIDAAPGAAFDPNQHQAVSQVPSDQPSGAIAETYQSGWKIGDRVLRAAMVAVSTGPAD